MGNRNTSKTVYEKAQVCAEKAADLGIDISRWNVTVQNGNQYVAFDGEGRGIFSSEGIFAIGASEAMAVLNGYLAALRAVKAQQSRMSAR